MSIGERNEFQQGCWASKGVECEIPGERVPASTLGPEGGGL